MIPSSATEQFSEILHYPDGQLVVEFLERPENYNQWFTEQDIDEMVPGREEWTAITLAVLSRCDVIKEEFDGKISKYILKKSTIIVNNVLLIKEVERFFSKNSNALISTIYLCRKFLSSPLRMRNILFDFKYDGFIVEYINDYYSVSEKYKASLSSVSTLSDRLFGQPIDTPNKTRRVSKSNMWYKFF